MDNRKNGLKGRVLRDSVGGLQAGDRLEGGEGVRTTFENVGKLEDSKLLFWRRVDTSFFNFWPPLLDVMRGDCVFGDVLHTLDAGVCQYCAGTVFAMFRKHNVLNLAGQNENAIQANLLRSISNEYVLWKPQWRPSNLSIESHALIE